MRFPSRIHSVSAVGAGPHDLLIQVDHTHLLDVYEHALETVKNDLAEMPKPKYSGTDESHRYNKLKWAISGYEEAIEWLKALKR